MSGDGGSAAVSAVPLGSRILLVALLLLPLSCLAQRTDHTAAIRKAIADVSASGGGVVTLPPGVLWVAADESGVALTIPAGVVLDLRGTELRLIENDKAGYQVLLFTGRGKPSGVVGGTIVGDRDRHLGTTGEWGMCISVRGATDVTIRDTKVFSCWGDGIYVGSGPDRAPAMRVAIDGVEAGHNRRNNISIVAADGFRVANVHLHNARGTHPEAGIDLEPNRGDRVENGVITDVLTEHNAKYGVLILGHAGPVRHVSLDRIRSRANEGPGYWVQSADDLAIGSLAATANRTRGLAIVRSSGIAIQSYTSEGNRLVLDVQQSAGIRIRDASFVHPHEDITPIRVDGHSTVRIGGGADW